MPAKPGWFIKKYWERIRMLVLLADSKKYNINNWWKSLTGIKNIFHEMIRYIYTVIVLSFLDNELK
jgi:hypothetical protein